MGRRHASLQGQDLRDMPISRYNMILPMQEGIVKLSPSNQLAEHEEIGKYITILELIP